MPELLSLECRPLGDGDGSGEYLDTKLHGKQQVVTRRDWLSLLSNIMVMFLVAFVSNTKE
jgi:hypothetical protein